MSRIFIDRPIFAWVLAIIVMLAGIGAILTLPIAQYPDVAPPVVNVSAAYPGASAEAIQNSVTQVIEQSLTGIDGMLYFSSSSSARGGATISVTFVKGTNPDIAQVQVQNHVTQAVARLPTLVQQQGVRVTKSNPDRLLILGVYDKTDRMTNRDISDWLATNLVDAIARTNGVGDTQVFGSQHGMRIWLNPARLASYSLMPSDVVTAILNQNTEIAAGEVGADPMPSTQMLDATVTAQSRLQTPEQFRNITLKTDTTGATVHLGDVARVELGSESYIGMTRANGHPGSGVAVSTAPGADALTTAENVKALVERTKFPPGLTYTYANDSTAFIKLSIEEVVKTLAEAIVLVVIVMFVFLQNWRALLIPAVAVPVVLLGTFAILFVTGYTINTLTMFGLVLSIGLLVDDAIVVVENVERLLEENPGMTPREATIRSMDQIQIALVAIALVLSAVFLPMAFFGGSIGVIYRQFSITIVSAMALSVLVALILSPALTATVLRSKDSEEHAPPSGRVGRWLGVASDKFNTGFHALVNKYTAAISVVVDRKWIFLLIYAGVAALLVVLFFRLPTGFLPTEDQGNLQIQWRLPVGATTSRSQAVQLAIENYLRTQEGKNMGPIFTAAGGGQGVTGQNTGNGFINLADWDKRPGARNGADAISQRAAAAFRNMRDAQVFVTVPGAIRGLGQANGFTMELLNTSGMTRDQFLAVRDKIMAQATSDPLLANVRLTDLNDVPTLNVNMDEQKLAALGLNQADVNSTLSTAWGGRYVNDFVDRGRVKRVFVQADAPYRSEPSDINSWYVRAANGDMTPFSSFARIGWSTAPSSLARFNGISSFEFQGQASPGHSSGEAMNEIEKLAKAAPGTDIAWSGLSFQERLSGGQAPLLYAISLVVVFLCLAALYESWTIPVAVLLIIPLGLVGAVFAVTLRGLQNDVYLQIGLLTTMGLASKNAILMIEFAERAEKEGKRVIEAALEAARIRIRPILMTSFAFIFGVLPLAISTGAGANSRIAIGTSVIGGMLTATLLAVFYIPLFFVLVRRTTRSALHALHHETPPPPPEPEFVP